jgi:hypothetical protein
MSHKHWSAANVRGLFVLPSFSVCPRCFLSPLLTLHPAITTTTTTTTNRYNRLVTV